MANNVRKPGKSNPWNALPLVLAGFLAFAGGAWFFTPKSAPVDEEPPLASAPAEEPAPAKPVSIIPEFNPYLTWTNFEKIRSGMTEAQLQKLFGSSTSHEIKQDANGLDVGAVLRWAQSNPPAHIEVSFRDGRSTSWTTNLSPPDLHVSTDGYSPLPNVAPSAYKKMREKYESIQAGMTEAEVTSVLGTADHTSARTSEYMGAAIVTRTLTWRPFGTQVTVTVMLRNGSVVGRNWKQTKR